MSQQADTRDTGFSLIEVVVSVAILAVGIGAGFHAIDSALYQTEAQADRIFAHNIAMNTAAELRWSGAGDADGRIETTRFAGQDWEVLIQALPTAAGFIETTIFVRRPTPKADDAASSAELVAYVRPWPARIPGTHIRFFFI